VRDACIGDWCERMSSGTNRRKSKILRQRPLAQWQAYLGMTVQNIATKHEPITSQDNRGWQSIADSKQKLGRKPHVAFEQSYECPKHAVYRCPDVSGCFWNFQFLREILFCPPRNDTRKVYKNVLDNWKLLRLMSTVV